MWIAPCTALGLTPPRTPPWVPSQRGCPSSAHLQQHSRLPLWATQVTYAALSAKSAKYILLYINLQPLKISGCQVTKFIFDSWNISLILFSFLPTVPNHETHLDPEMTNNSQPIGDPTVTNASESPSEEFITSSDCRRESTRSSRRAGPRVSGRGLKKRKVSVADGILLHEDTLDKTGGMMEEHCEDQTTTNFEASRETPLTHSIPEQAPVDTELSGQTCTDAEHCIDSDGKLECHGSLDAPTSDCPPSGEDTLEPAQRKTKRGRRSSLNSSVLQGQENQAEEHQTSHEGEEREQGDQAANQQQSNIRSSSDSQEEGGAANLDLAPWQTDFNFEDVFKSVATRGKRSVRRSLRNQSNAEHSSNSAGLAWLSQTPPDTSKEARRRTRGQRLSAAPPAQPSLPEET